jgi:UDP-N-acetylglucosamine:LPS N-acetylglucosamine transferase
MFVASTGGHLFELLELEEIFEKYDYYIVTEKTDMTVELVCKYRTRVFFLLFISRKFLFLFVCKFFLNCLYSFWLFIKIRPQYIVTTGSNTAVPMCFIGKLFNKKVIFIETRADFDANNSSARLVYRIADLFVVQNKSLCHTYPKAVLCQFSH